MQFEVKMRDGSTHEIEAAYIEVTNGQVNTSYTLLGPVPGYPTAILAAFPVDLVESMQPAASSDPPIPQRSTEPDAAAQPAATPREEGSQ